MVDLRHAIELLDRIQEATKELGYHQALPVGSIDPVEQSDRVTALETELRDVLSSAELGPDDEESVDLPEALVSAVHLDAA